MQALKKCYLQKNENETPTCRKAIFSEKSRDRALFMLSFVNLYDSLKDAQIWVREIMIIFAFSNIDNHCTTVQWMVTNDTDAREEKKYETITPSFDVVASQPMPRPYM